MLAVQALDHLVLNVRDVEASAAWYGRVLGTTRQEARSREGEAPRVSIGFGSQKINLRPVGESQAVWFTADRPTAGSDDLCFLTNEGPEAVLAHLAACGVPVERGPVQPQGARGTLRSVYCRDPDGNLVEIASYA